MFNHEKEKPPFAEVAFQNNLQNQQYQNTTKKQQKSDIFQKYIAAGFPVFPCHGVTDKLRCTCGKYPCGEGNKTAGKHPYTLHGCKDASNDAVAVEKLFNYRNDLNVGIVTGKPSGVFVMDIDCEDSLAGYELPLTLTTTTGRGRHLLF